MRRTGSFAPARNRRFGPVAAKVIGVLRHSGFRYLLIGGASFIIDFALLALLYQLAGWPIWLATGTAFLTSFVFNYALQRSFSFGSDASHLHTLVRYLCLLAFNTLATIAIVWLIERGGWGWELGKIAATVTTTVWNYFVFKYWVFPRSADEMGADGTGNDEPDADERA